MGGHVCSGVPLPDPVAGNEEVAGGNIGEDVTNLYRVAVPDSSECIPTEDSYPTLGTYHTGNLKEPSTVSTIHFYSCLKAAMNLHIVIVVAVVSISAAAYGMSSDVQGDSKLRNLQPEAHGGEFERSHLGPIRRLTHEV